MELTRGVHALEVSADLGERTLTIYPTVVATDHGAILVDVGLETHVDATIDALHDAGFSLDDIATIVLTHQDGDHVGGLAEVADATDATVMAHRLSTPFINGERDLAKGDSRYPPVPVDVQLVDGVQFRTWGGQMHVVFTPGHAPGHISLYFPDSGLVLAADALTAADGELHGPSEEHTLDWSTAIDSIATLADLEVTQTHCYHGGPTDAGTTRLESLANSL